MIRVLSILLVVQIAVVAAVYWPTGAGTETRSALLMNMERANIDAITVSDNAGTTSTLQRRDGEWSLEYGLPVDTAKIDTLLSALLDQDPGYAIALSANAAQRFQTSDDDYERRVELKAGATSQTVYLGTSPSFRKVHARLANEDAVFVVELNNYDAPATGDSWFDRSLLSVTDAQRIELYGNTFTLGNESWRRDDGDEPDPSAMEGLVQALAGLRVNGITAEDDENLGTAVETLRITAGNDSGNNSGNNSGNSTLTLLENEEADRFYVRGDAYPTTFDTSAYDAERLVDAVGTLMGESNADEESPEDAALPEGPAVEASEAVPADVSTAPQT